MPKSRFPCLFVILVLFTTVIAGGMFCQAKIPEALNTSRTIPVDLLERDGTILEKLKEISSKKVNEISEFPKPSRFNTPTTITSHPTLPIPKILAETTGYTILPTSDTHIHSDIQPQPTSEVTETTNPDILGIIAQNLFFSVFIIFALLGGSTVLALVLISKDTHRSAGGYPNWYPFRRIFLGAHTLMAALFFIELLLLIVSLSLWNSFSSYLLPLTLVSGFLLAYGAASSVGMSFFSYSGKAMRIASLGHLVLSAAGAFVSVVLMWKTILPFSTMIPAATFIISFCIVCIQAMIPGEPGGKRAVNFKDTLLFEERSAPYVPPFPPELEQRYSDAKFLHQGGVARVFFARRREDGVEVAVKIPIKTDEQTGRSLLREMGVWRTLLHPGIVQVNSANILPIPYVEMEYLPGSLADIPVPMKPCDAAYMIRKIALALAFAHERGVIHRDLKPGNILLSQEGEPKIGDWGLSRNDSVPAETTLHGFSLSYASPEQLDPSRFGRTTNKTDIYQLGIIFYQCVTGVLPFPGESIADITRERLDGRIKVPSLIVSSAGVFDAIIERCIARDPTNRYDSVMDLVKALDICIREVCSNSRAQN